MQMLTIAGQTFNTNNADRLPQLTLLEEEVDKMKKELTSEHFTRLSEGTCKFELSPYYFSSVLSLERVADHIVNVGYSILNPVGSETDID